MQYLITFVEGVISFVSPCLLPMLQVYVAFFAGGGAHAGRAAVKNAAGFVLGFTVLFVALGAFAGLLGGFLARHTTAVNLVTGGIVVGLGEALHGPVAEQLESLPHTLYAPRVVYSPSRDTALFGAAVAAGLALPGISRP